MPDIELRQLALSKDDNIHCHMARTRRTDPGLRKVLDVQLRQIAWSYASGAASGFISDPEDVYFGSVEGRRAGALGLLRIYALLAAVLEGRIDQTVELALTNGASFGDIGSARGISRQAARQRWLRSRAREEARAARLLSRKPMAEHEEFLPDRPVPPAEAPVGIVSAENLSFREPAGDAEDQDEKAGAESYIGQRSARPSGPKVRVRELAAEFGVTSAVVMQKLKETGEFVRSASSTVEEPVARVLREYFARQQEVRD
jgi:translation initiation factor IF-2-like protein